MSDQMSAPSKSRRTDLAGTILAITFIVIGCLAWRETYDMGDADSYVFPRAVIVILIVCCLLLIGRNIIWGGGKNHQYTDGSMLRRIGLVVAMAVAALAMPMFGFLTVGMMLFGVLMMLAMFEPWTRKLKIKYSLIGATIVVTFYVLFAVLLHVTLPIGTLFE